MVTQKRQRQRESRQARMVAVQQARKKKAQRKRLAVVVFTAVLLVLGVSVFVSGNGGQNVASTNTTTVPARKAVTLTSVAPGATIMGDTPCPKADGSSLRTTAFSKPPPMCIVASRTYSADMVTSKGKITIALDPKAAPTTVNNFVVLSRYHYYDGIPFHRIIPGFVVQGGDPQATGSGGPGYRIDDELPKAGSYKVGSVAMANSGPNTNGSQFFIVTGDAGVNLPPSYALFGTVTEGMDVVKSIEAIGTPATATDPGGEPTEVVTISSVTIKET